MKLFRAFDVLEHAEVINPLAETPVKMLKKGENYFDFVTIEEVQEFYDYLKTIFDANFHVQDNILHHNLRHCDCIQWLYNEFDHIRQIAPRRILKAFDEHNTFCAAIWCFCIEAGIITRPECRYIKEKVGGVSSWWWHHVFPHVGEGYRRNRKKTKPHHRNFEPRDVTPAKMKWDRFYANLVARFPKFFTRIDNKNAIHKAIFDRADPGPVFNCLKCDRKFPRRYGISCEPILENRDGPFRGGAVHESCRACMRDLVSNNEINAVGHKLNADRYIILITCVHELCSRLIDPEKIQFFLPPNLRRKLRNSLIQALVDVSIAWNHCQYDPDLDTNVTVRYDSSTSFILSSSVSTQSETDACVNQDSD
uniref:Uncharacterized protein n=1 Tax=Acrobeloides nanus TaxID=290746 RepID=A0A914DRA5_9BILA